MHMKIQIGSTVVNKTVINRSWWLMRRGYHAYFPTLYGN